KNKAQFKLCSCTTTKLYLSAILLQCRALQWFHSFGTPRIGLWHLTTEFAERLQPPRGKVMHMFKQPVCASSVTVPGSVSVTTSKCGRPTTFRNRCTRLGEVN